MTDLAGDGRESVGSARRSVRCSRPSPSSPTVPAWMAVRRVMEGWENMRRAPTGGMVLLSPIKAGFAIEKPLLEPGPSRFAGVNRLTHTPSRNGTKEEGRTFFLRQCWAFVTG